MDANNTTGLSDIGNVTGALDANSTGAAGAVSVSLTDLIFVTLGIFVVSWLILCLVMYIIAPFWSKFADQRSRVIYSAIYSFPFAVIFALGLGGTMSLISQSNFLFSLLAALIIVFGLVMLQSLLLGMLIDKGILRMQSKRGPQGPVKGGRNTKGKRK